MTDTSQLIKLCGDPYARGLQQAQTCPAQIAAVRIAVENQIAARRQFLRSPEVVEFLAGQWAFLRIHDPDGHRETCGIAAGFGIAADDLFTYLHLNIITDMEIMRARGTPYGDGCTAWAASAAGVGAWVVKNRDYRGEHGSLQRVFHHSDPAWKGRSLLCVGSLGSPGAFSSGINSDGLAVVDTQVGSSDHGVGWLRYFLMTFLLRSCSSVNEALEQISAIPHAGGGTLVMGDAQGQVAAVELGHRRLAIDAPGLRYTVRTNHFIGAATSGIGLRHQDDELAQSSDARRSVVCGFLQAEPDLELGVIQSLMSGHDQSGQAALCRHGLGAAARTLSTAIYTCKIPALVLSHGAPCLDRWETFSFPNAFG